MQFHLIYVLLISEDVTTARTDITSHRALITAAFVSRIIMNSLFASSPSIHPARRFLSLPFSSAAAVTRTRRHYLIIQEMEIEVNGDGGDESQRKKEILKHSDMALICKMSI